jgi:hypothetical protein
MKNQFVCHCETVIPLAGLSYSGEGFGFGQLVIGSKP